jgi:hypothetical protein
MDHRNADPDNFGREYVAFRCALSFILRWQSAPVRTRCQCLGYQHDEVYCPTINLDNNDVKLDATRGILQRDDPTDTSKTPRQITNSYLGVDADFFGNNSLGIGLQQTYALEYQYYLRDCTNGRSKAQHRMFASFGIGAGFMSQRLYVPPATVNVAVLPLSAQFSYLSGENPGVPPKLIWYGLLEYMPVLTDLHAYQVSGILGVQIPTKYQWLTFYSILCCTTCGILSQPGWLRPVLTSRPWHQFLVTTPSVQFSGMFIPPPNTRRAQCYGMKKL